MQHKVDVLARMCGGGRIEAVAEVTLDQCIRFSVMFRRGTNEETKKEKAFLSYPRRCRSGEWEDAILMDEVLKKHIMGAVGNAIKEEVTEEKLPAVTKVTLNLANQGKRLTGNVIVRGMADVEIDGLTIRGVSLKETPKGYLINMPQYKAGSGEYRNLIDIISGSMMQRIKEAVLSEYAARAGQEINA